MHSKQNKLHFDTNIFQLEINTPVITIQILEKIYLWVSSRGSTWVHSETLSSLYHLGYFNQQYCFCFCTGAWNGLWFVGGLGGSRHKTNVCIGGTPGMHGMADVSRISNVH